MGCEVCGEGLVGVGVVDGMADCRDSPMSRAGEPIGPKSMEDLDNCPFSPLTFGHASIIFYEGNIAYI